MGLKKYYFGKSKNLEIYDIKDVVNIPSLSISPNDVMWFKPYLASDFPEITCDKTYFFLYCTDHAGASSTNGQIWWGKGNNLDCSDFVEQGIIMSGYQSESPFMIRIPTAECGDSEVIHLYYHTASSDPSNSSKQQTHLITTTGGILHTTTWTQRGTVLGVSGTENHTGYLKLYRLGASNYKGTHLNLGGLPQNYSFSSSSTGRSFTRSNTYKKSFLLDFLSQYKIIAGTMFERYGKYWYIGNIAPVNFSGDTTFCLIRLDSNLQPEYFCKLLNKGIGIPIVNEKVIGDLEVYIENDLAYIYWKEGTKIKMGKYNLNDLFKYKDLINSYVNTISYYDLESYVIDLVSNNDGTPFSMTYTFDSVYGYVGNFNGTTSQVITTNAVAFQANNIGVELYIKSSGTGTGLKALVVKQFTFGIFSDSGILKLYSWGGTTGFRVTSTNLNDNVWHKIRVEFRNGVTNGTLVYVDNILVLTTTYTFLNQTKKLVIGNGDDGSGSSSGQYINAKIANVKIFNL